MSPVALWHVESTWTEDQTHVLGVDGQILIPGSPGKSSSSFLATLIHFKITYKHQYILPLSTSACLSLTRANRSFIVLFVVLFACFGLGELFFVCMFLLYLSCLNKLKNKKR